MNRHNQAPSKSWLTPDEKRLIINFYLENIDDGYRRCTYMMIDQNIVAASPSAVYRALVDAEAIRSKKLKKSLKGTGYKQPTRAHQEWHTDISYLKIGKVFYYLVCVLDGYSRSIIHWDIRESMKDQDVHMVLQVACEMYPNESPTIISDRGSQYSGKEFKRFINNHGLGHVMTSAYYPQSNGKLERFHQSIKNEALRKGVPLTLEDAKRIAERYIRYYNEERLHSAIGYITPQDKLNGKEDEIFKTREQRLEKARKQRIIKNNQNQLKIAS